MTSPASIVPKVLFHITHVTAEGSIGVVFCWRQHAFDPPMRVKGLVEVRTGDAHCNANWPSVWKMGKYAFSLVVSYDNFAKCSGRSCSVNIEFYMAHIDRPTLKGLGDFTVGGSPA